jgi:recombinational DNA repair ATPase RecF
LHYFWPGTLNNLNTHVLGALYEAFAPEEAQRIATRLEFHYTPKHSSWLNRAEMEFSVLARQCLNRRIETAQELAKAIAAWERVRNEAQTKIEWSFRVADARKKLETPRRSPPGQ